MKPCIPCRSSAEAACVVDGVVESAALPAGVAAKVAMKLGIDEAGRGCVLGAMTFGCALWAIEDDAAICALGFDDSKALTHAQRVTLFDRIIAERRIAWAVNVISAATLSRQMLQRQPVSLNQISFDATVELIQRALDRGANVEEAYVDTVGDPATYERRLTQAFDGRIKFTVAKKADSLYKTVGAASICAKVTRDAALEAWTFEEPKPCDDRGFGSGYPSDPACKAWLQRNGHAVFGYPSLVRFSWAPTKRLLHEIATEDATGAAEAIDFVSNVAKCDWPDDDDDDDEAANSMKITDWAAAKPRPSAFLNGAKAAPKRKRSKFYRHLDTVAAF